jgi:hypothetical protein
MMRYSFLFKLVLLAMVSICALAWGQEPFTMATPSADTLKPLTPALRDLLDPQGNSVVTMINGVKTTALTVWWRKSIPTLVKPVSEPGVIYDVFQVGALVGVLNFPPESTADFREDSRDQKLKPGFYTMRYAQMPSDARHKDASTYRDFVLLSPVTLDTDYTKILSLDELISLSNHASRTKHPAVITLVPVNDVYKPRPGLVSDDRGQCTLQVKLHAKTPDSKMESEVHLAIVLVTPQKEMGGS